MDRMGYIIAILFQTLYEPYGAYITQHTRKYGPCGPYIAEITRKYGLWGSYIAQPTRKISQIKKSIVLLENPPKKTNGNIYNFQASKIQNMTKIQIYRKSNKKAKTYPIATKHVLLHV